MRPIEAALEATPAELEAAQKTKPSGKTPDDLTEYLETMKFTERRVIAKMQKLDALLLPFPRQYYRDIYREHGKDTMLSKYNFDREKAIRERMTAHERKLEADVTESFSTLHALIYMLEETKKNRRMQPESCRTADA